MIKKFLKAASAAVCLIPVFIGCQKDVCKEQIPAEKTTLTVSVLTDDTKVVSGANDAAINDYQVFLFREDFSLEDYKYQTSPDITLECVMGKKYLVVLVNAPYFGDVDNYQTLMTKKSLLSDNELDSIVMEGQNLIEILTQVPSTIKIQVTRKVARVELSSLTVDIDMPQYSSKPFKVSSVYLINVPSEIPYFASSSIAPLSWYNKLAYNPEDVNTLIYDDMNGFEVTESTPYTVTNTFYCYPNNTTEDTFSETWAPRHTRLVVEATLGDELYYYPVTLPKLEQNKIYGVNLTITRPGSKTPDSLIDMFETNFQVSVKDWVRGTTVNEQI